MNNLAKKLLIISVLLLAQGSSFSQPTSEHFSFPAEFEKQDAVWMTWVDGTFFAGDSIGENILEIIKQLVPYVRVTLFVNDDSTRTYLHKRFSKNGIDVSKVNMIIYRDPWFNLRDPGPVFLKGSHAHLMIADMKWNVFGLLDTADAFCVHVDTIDRAVARMMNVPVRRAKIAGEGGDREFNGKGTMMAVQSTEMSRNKGMPRDSIEKELLREFGQKKMIWLKKGPIDDEEVTYGKLPGNIYPNGVNHIDEFCRFVSSNTILLAEMTTEEAQKDSLNMISYQRLKEDLDILRHANDQDGRPFNIVRMPAAETMTARFRVDSADDFSLHYFHGCHAGDTVTYILATSYLNFLITNNAVLMPSYWKEGRPESMKLKDEKAKAIMEKLFPDRKIIQINVEALNHGGGGIHCATQQQPATD
jgi:agmatine deiminase